MLELKSSYHYFMGDLGNICPSCELSFFGLNISTCELSLQISRSHSWASSLLWNPHHLRPIHIDDDILGHPNGAVPTLLGGAIAFVPPVRLGVDERTLDCKLLLILLIRKLLPWLRALVRLVAFFVAL